MKVEPARAFRLLSMLNLAALVLLIGTGCNQRPASPNPPPAPAVTFKPQEMADALHAIIAADREVYALHVIQRLQAEEQVVRAAENWKEEKALPLPEQMLRMASESVQKKGVEFHYVLRSLAPLNSRNAPQTATEKAGLEFVAGHPGTNYYAEESLGGRRYFTAVYPDLPLTSACADCHNQHPASPRKNYKPGEVIGGVIVRVPLEF